MKSGPMSLGGLTLRELTTRVWRQLYADSAWDKAAQLGYYFMLALFPLALFLTSLLTILHALDVVGPFLEALRRLMPPQAFALLSTEVERLASSPRGDLLTIGALGAIWASSSGVEALLTAFNRAYDVVETRSYVRVRLTAIVMTFVIGLLIVAGGVLLAFGDRLAAGVISRSDWPWASRAAEVANYLLGLVAMLLGLEVVYYYGPNVANKKWRWVSPGSLACVLLFVLSSSGFSLYLRHSDSYDVMYGSVGGVVIMLLWLYILALALITGGEINAQVAAEARSRGEVDAPMIGVEGATPVAPVDAPPPAPLADDPVGELVLAIRRERGYAKAALVRALGEHGAAAEPTVPDLIAALDDEHPAVRAEAVAALARVGANASKALPSLHELATGEDPALRDAAGRAIEAIEAAEDPHLATRSEPT